MHRHDKYIMESIEYQSPLYLMFIEYEKVLDSVNRDCMWVALRNRGIPNKLINLIKEIYNGINVEFCIIAEYQMNLR